MCAKERGLGRGLDSLFRNADALATGSDNTKLPVASLKANQEQPRRHFDEQALEDLANSIRSQGIIQPILVRPLPENPQQYEIVAGERRWRAAQRAGLTEVPVIIRTLSDEEVLTIALIENIQREDLNAVEEAQAIEMLRQTLNIGQDELSRRLGNSRSTVANALRLLQLPEKMLDSVASGHISAGHARCLLAVTDAAAQQTLHEAMLCTEISVRDAETAVTYWKNHGRLPENLTGNPVSQKPKAPKAAKSVRSKMPVIRSLQRHLRSQLHSKVTLSGTMDMGRITLPYESAAQLASLLTHLGINLEEIAENPEESA